MGDDSLFYRPKSAVLSTITTYLGGPTPSRKDYPALRFGSDGVEYHESYGSDPSTRLRWKDVRAVAVLPGPVPGRQALCVYAFRELPHPDAYFNFSRLFGTPVAVHWHHVRGPSLGKLAERLPAWTDGRIRLTTTRP